MVLLQHARFAINTFVGGAPAIRHGKSADMRGPVTSMKLARDSCR